MPKVYETYIAGVKHHQGRELLQSLSFEDPNAEPVFFTLEAEPENPYDAFAVRILHEGTMLGYVPKFNAPRISKALLGGDAKVTCEFKGKALVTITITSGEEMLGEDRVGLGDEPDETGNPARSQDLPN